MRLAALALALLAVPAAAFAQEKPAEEKPASLDEAFYRAFYAENGLRDFEKAADAYAKVAETAAKAGNKDLQGKALLGRVRCLRTSGKEDAAKEAVQAALEVDPGNGEAKALLSAISAGSPQGDGLEARIFALVGYLEEGCDTSILRELRLAGDRAVPFLEESLVKKDLRAVENAALFLSHFATPASRAALLNALRAKDVPYGVAIAEAFCSQDLPGFGVRPVQEEDLPLLEAVAARPEVALRFLVINRLNTNWARPDSMLPLVLRLAGDPDPMVRVSVLRTSWPERILRGLEPAIRASLASRDAQERAAAVAAAGKDGDLLRALQAGARALLKDESASVRQAAFKALADRDGLTQEDLAGLLDDPDGALVRGAAERLKANLPWGEKAAAAARKAVGKAMRLEIPEEAIWPVAKLVQVTALPGGFTPEEWVDLFAATWSPDFRWGAEASANFRQQILILFETRVRPEVPTAEINRCVLDGVRSTASADGVVQWIEFWKEKAGNWGREAWLAASSHASPRVRRLAYEGLVRSQTRTENGRDVGVDPLTVPGSFGAAFPHLADDLASEDGGLRESALSVAALAPDSSLAKPLRELHDRAAGYARARLLEVLVKAAGKDAMDAVRGDLASKEREVRSEALGRLVITLGVEDYGEIQAYLERGGSPSEVATLWNYSLASAPSVDLLRAFLEGLSPDRIDEEVLSAARLLPAAERWQYHAMAFRSATPSVRRSAAYMGASWRAVEAIPLLSDLLDDPENEVREAAKFALQELKNYIELKASAARIGKGGEEKTFRVAEEMLGSEDPVKRRGAVLALAALGDKAAIPALLRALDDKDPGVRDAALSALERLGGRPAKDEEK